MRSAVLSLLLTAASVALWSPAVAAPTLGIAAAGPTCAGKKVTILGTAGDDRITGTKKADVILALGGNDSIRGRGGADVICAGEGSDRVYGGRGRDVLFGGPDGISNGTIRGDLIAPGRGKDRVDLGGDTRLPLAKRTMRDTISYARAHRGVRVSLAAGRPGWAKGEGRDVIRGRNLAVLGSRFADEIQGSRWSEVFRPGQGNDRVYGGPGADLLFDLGPVTGSDLAYGGPGADSFITQSGTDIVSGDAGPDRFRVVISRATRCMILDGGQGADHATLIGPPGAFITVNAKMRRLGVGGGGCGAISPFEQLQLVGVGVRWKVKGSGRDEELRWSTGTVTASMGAGRDRVIGNPGTGNDVVKGGKGKDFADPGSGYDICKGFEQQRNCEG